MVLPLLEVLMPFKHWAEGNGYESNQQLCVLKNNTAKTAGSVQEQTLPV